MIFVEYFGLFILLAVIVLASMPEKFYHWFERRLSGKRKEQQPVQLKQSDLPKQPDQTNSSDTPPYA